MLCHAMPTRFKVEEVEEMLQVVEISLQCTLFQRWDGIRITYPNAKLSTEPILNVSRSANRWEGFKVKAVVNVLVPVKREIESSSLAILRISVTTHLSLVPRFSIGSWHLQFLFRACQFHYPAALSPKLERTILFCGLLCSQTIRLLQLSLVKARALAQVQH